MYRPHLRQYTRTTFQGTNTGIIHLPIFQILQIILYIEEWNAHREEQLNLS